MTTSYMNRARGRSFSQQPSDDELLSIEKQFDFINLTFKYSINDFDSIIAMLRARYAAEDAYLTALYKVRKMASNNDGERPSFNHESQLTFQTAVKLYEATVNDMIDSRQRLRDTIRLEIDNLVKQKEQEEQNRKTYKTVLSEANANYTTFRNRDIIKYHKTYTHKCEDLKIAQNNFQMQQIQQQQQQYLQQQQLAQQQQQQQYHQDGSPNEYYKANRTSTDFSNPSRMSGEHGSRDMDSASILSYNNNMTDQHNKKGVAGLISQMRTRAAGNTYMAPLDQNKQITKVAKMKKDIAEADNEYREGILVLENLRKKQTKATEEVNKQLKNTIKRKTDTVKISLTKILQSELETLKIEMETSTASYAAAVNIDSHKDIQIFSMHYQAQNYISPTPVRYENFYLEGKCREVLFGGSLESYAIEHNRAVPMLVIKCIEAIEGVGGLQKEGIYRVSGRQSNIEQLKHQFELDEDKVNLEAYDVFTIATVLKMYIRELKRPLFEFNVQTRSAYSKNMPQNQRFNLMETKLSNLSLAHRSTLHSIVRHLSKVNANSQYNKMNIQNLALIFTPVIFHDFNQSDEGTTSDWSPDDLFEDLILNYEFLFPISEENARKNNEHKLNLALNGKSPFSQFSQSNLLYLTNAVIATPSPSTPSNMLLTQPVNPAMLAGSADSPGGPNSMDQQHNSPYPPNLTTIIGAAPPANAIPQTQQRMASLQQQSYSAGAVRPNQNPVIGGNNNTSNEPSARIVPPRYQSEGINPPPFQQQQQKQMGMNRSTSDTTVMPRGSSMSNTASPVDNNVSNNYDFTAQQVPNSSTNSSPMPTRTNSDASTVPILPKRNSSVQLQQKPFVKPGALPRQDSLRRANPRFQNAGTGQTPNSGDQSESVSVPASGNHQAANIPHPIITNTAEMNSVYQQPQQQQQQQHSYYQAELNQDFVLSSVNESNLDSLIDYYSPTTTENIIADPKTSPK